VALMYYVYDGSDSQSVIRGIACEEKYDVFFSNVLRILKESGSCMFFYLCEVLWTTKATKATVILRV